MPFKPGDPRINRQGRPKGSKTRTTESFKLEMAGMFDQATQVLRDALQEGDTKTAMYIINKVLPDAHRDDGLQAELDELKEIVAQRNHLRPVS